MFRRALVLCLFVMAWPKASEAGPWEVPRTGIPRYNLYGSLAAVEGMQKQLGFALGLAEQYGHIAHLEHAAQGVRKRLRELTTNNPLKMDETQHLELALGELEAYLGASDRSVRALVPHYSHVKKALEKLKWIQDRLKVQRGLH